MIKLLGSLLAQAPATRKYPPLDEVERWHNLYMEASRVHSLICMLRSAHLFYTGGTAGMDERLAELQNRAYRRFQRRNFTLDALLAKRQANGSEPATVEQLLTEEDVLELLEHEG